MNKEVYQVRVVLNGEMARRFRMIKEKYGLEANTDVIRLLITLECDRIERLEAGHPTLRTYVPIE